jgi:hypothetical protein
VIVRAATRSKIEHETKTLAREFPAVPYALIAAEVEATAARLVEHARIDDYLPVLVYRYAREALSSRESALASAQAA